MVLASEGAILSAINSAYDLGRDSAQEFIQIMNGDSADSIISEIEETADLLDETSDAPIIKLVNLVLAAGDQGPLQRHPHRALCQTR